MVRDAFSDFSVVEETTKLLELDRQMLIELGPVDAGLVKLTRASEGDRPRVLLTNDGPLMAYCRGKEISALLVWKWIYTLPLDS